ncbi:hypothetical protein J2T58_002088 [Methanocalculus alkaliphilus]|nr:hypothetical protein [Methanocalculus alkaliphilus]
MIGKHGQRDVSTRIIGGEKRSDLVLLLPEAEGIPLRIQAEG